MQTDMPLVLESLRKAESRSEAVRCFLDVLEGHRDHTEDIKRRVEQVYRFETPDRPVFQFDVMGFEYQESGWVGSDLDRLLDGGMQELVFKLESMPESDFIPLLHTGIGRSDLIPRMFGVTFDYPDDGSVLQRFNLIEELPRDLDKLKGVEVTQTEPWRDVVERVCFLAGVTEGKVHTAYPQMQGPLTNAARLMNPSEMLMACHTDPESMRVLANTWEDVASQLILTLQQVAGDAALLRPRARFYQPTWIRALIVGDYLAVMRPEQYFEVCADAWEAMYCKLGPIFYHTCGPVWRSLEVLKKLPGLAGFECSYVRGQTGRTADLAEVKKRLEGKIVLHSFEWLLGGAVEDMDNLTAEWLRDMSRGGGFMMQDSGTLEEGRALFEKLELI